MKIKGLILLLTALGSCKPLKGLVCNEIYVRKDKDAVLSFHANISSNNIIVGYKIWSPATPPLALVTVSYFNNQVFGPSNFNSCSLIGTLETGDLKIKLNKPYPSGEYFLEKPENQNLTKYQCITMYILDIPVKPTVSTDKFPFVGSTVTLTCSSRSTTTPSNHSLGLLYNWMVDGLDNPSDSRYAYTLSRRNLTLSNVIKDDRNKQFTCNATENVADGYTSLNSNNVSITVHYGPDSVSLLPNNTTYSVDENAHLADINCSADCLPACSYMWKKANQPNAVTNTGVLPLGAISPLYSGVYTCTATSEVMPSKYQEAKVTIEVNYGPDENSTKLMPVKQQYTENENETALPDITCSADCFPPCSIVWTKQPNNAVLMATSQGVLSLGTPSRRDAAIYTCRVTNPARVSSPTFTRDVNLKVRYGPDSADLNVPNSYVITEGETVGSLKCSSDCYPNCSYQWTKDSVAVGSDGIIQLGTAARQQAGNYTCTSTNTASQYQKSRMRSTNIIVRYPPDVTITAYNASVNVSSIVLECIARGVPNSNYKYGKWIQIWPGGTIVSKRSGSSRLEIFNLTYEHSGIYICSASNGVRVYDTETEYMEGSTFLHIASFPIFTQDKTTVPAKLNTTSTFVIEYYSNVNITDIKCYKVLNGSQQDGSVCNVKRISTNIYLPVFTQMISTPGEVANISIKIDGEQNFGPYNVMVTNTFGSAVRMIYIKPEGPPNSPKDLRLDDIEQTTVKLSWIPGFNGGFIQKYVIQIHSGTGDWKNEPLVNEDVHVTTIKGLEHSTTYFVRMFASNERGNSSFTETFNFTTLPEEKLVVEAPPLALIGGVAGGVPSVIVIAGIIIVLVRRRIFWTKGTDTSRLPVKKKERQQTEEDSSDEDVMVENKMYESAGQNMARDEPVYNKPTKSIKADLKNADVYAVVNKSKTKEKLKNEKPKKKKHVQQGDIYENAPEKSTAGNNTYGNAAFEDNPYENPDGFKSSKSPKKNINPDGLIYADLAFNDQPKGQKKLVIHGLDEMTTYVQVDFNKKADPLPDSDTEEQSEKKKI